MTGHVADQPQPAAHLGAGQAGEHEVEQDEVRAELVEPQQRVGPGRGGDDVEALALELVRQRVAVGLLVLDEQDPGHDALRRTCAPSGSRGVAGDRVLTPPSWGVFRARQAQGERRAAAGLRPDGHVPAVVRRDVLDDGQAEAGAARVARAGGVHAVEPLEHPLLLGRG